jgi:alkanesulfonate monooxygenase SsuD/methylene tetrahydromethanopterin reductase-like flavin-dependent oxidoreductase (luciferase family)
LGKDLNPYRFGYLQLICVAETDAQAEKDYAEHLEYFYNKCVHIGDEFADAPGYRTEATVRAGLRGQGGNAASMFRKGLKWKDFVDRSYVVAGSPATVRDKLTWILKDLNVGQLMALQQIGSMPKHLVMKNTELFAKEVMPSIKKIWSEEWEDRWSPKPLPLRERAVPGQAEAR